MDTTHTLFQSGLLERAMQVCESALRATPDDLSAGRAFRGFSPRLMLFYQRATLLIITGRLAEARRDLERGLELSREQGELEIPGWAHYWLAYLSTFTGDLEAGLLHARSCLENAEQTGSRITAVLGYRGLGAVHIARGAWDEAATALTESLRITRTEDVAQMEEPILLAGLADAHLGSGDIERALASSLEAIEVSRSVGTRWKEITAHLSQARALRARGTAEAREGATMSLGAAEDLVNDTGARVYLPFLLEERAALAAQTGDESRREQYLREAHRLFTEMSATGNAERLARELEQD